MSKSKQFKFLKIFHGKVFFDKFVSLNLTPYTVYKTVKLKNCQICNRVGCEMRVQYAFTATTTACIDDPQQQLNSASNESCRYKIETCVSTQTIYLSKACGVATGEMMMPSRASTNTPSHIVATGSMVNDGRKKFGLTARVKEIVEQIIGHETAAEKSKPVHVQNILQNNYADFVDHMPTLRQIQSYLSTRRKRMSG